MTFRFVDLWAIPLKAKEVFVGNDYIHTQPYSLPCNQFIRQERWENVLSPPLLMKNKLTGYWVNNQHSVV